MNVYRYRGDIRYILKGLKYNLRYWYYLLSCSHILLRSALWYLIIYVKLLGKRSEAAYFPLFKNNNSNNKASKITEGQNTHEQFYLPGGEWLEVMILIVVCVQSPLLPCWFTAKQCHLYFIFLLPASSFPARSYLTNPEMDLKVLLESSQSIMLAITHT